LPARPSLEHLKNQAKQLLDAMQRGEPQALRQLDNVASSNASSQPTLANAQYALAQQYGFASWRALKAHVDEVNQHLAAMPASEADRKKAVVQAATQGDTPRLQALLDAHPELIHAGGEWNRPLTHAAAYEGRLEVVRMLLDRGFDVNKRCESDNATAMFYAAEKGALDVVKLLHEAGGDVHADGDGHELGVLGWATCFAFCRDDVAAYLMAQGVEPHIFAAIAMNDEQRVRQIVANDPAQLQRQMSPNEHRRLPLHHAAEKGKSHMVKLLLELGADPQATDDHGSGPLSYARDDASARLLDEAGATMDMIGALTLGRYDLAQALFDEDPTRLGPDGSDTVALHMMATRNLPDAVRWLIEHGVAINAIRKPWAIGCQITALHAATEAKGDATEVVNLLLQAGADITFKDDVHGGTPVNWAHYFDKPKLAKRIEGGAL